MADNGAPALIVETEPDLGSVNLLEEWLYEFNVQTTGMLTASCSASSYEIPMPL